MLQSVVWKYCTVIICHLKIPHCHKLSSEILHGHKLLSENTALSQVAFWKYKTVTSCHLKIPHCHKLSSENTTRSQAVVWKYLTVTSCRLKIPPRSNMYEHKVYPTVLRYSMRSEICVWWWWYCGKNWPSLGWVIGPNLMVITLYNSLYNRWWKRQSPKWVLPFWQAYIVYMCTLCAQMDVGPKARLVITPYWAFSVYIS